MQKWQPAEKYVHVYALSTWLGLFLHYYNIKGAWHGGFWPLALLRCYGSPGYSDSGF